MAQVIRIMPQSHLYSIMLRMNIIVYIILEAYICLLWDG